MPKITRNKDELGDVPFIAFNVWTYSSNEDDASVCGYQVAHKREAGINCFRQRTSIWIPVAQAFENVCHDAKTRGISTIWINDPDRLFPNELFEMPLSQ